MGVKTRREMKVKEDIWWSSAKRGERTNLRKWQEIEKIKIKSWGRRCEVKEKRSGGQDGLKE